ncbi:response regulator transcription factor [Brevibacillus sp. SYSU BS000544]|uniref:response regulator transcription factor n=1 Tax=Brevibacillus sp. SYSU BS000544 TaxID=3416443 RepID=UPI003CE5104D
MRLLVVEDDVRLATVLSKGLREEGYQVDVAQDGEEALLFTKDREYEVIILDRKLPRVSGDKVLATIRSNGCSVPILLLTALDSIDDRVAGLTKGADDYVCKPFAFEELLARIQTLRRRKNTAYYSSILEWDELQLDTSTHQVLYKGSTVDLTTRELRILEVFLRKPEQIIPRERLAEQVWDEPWDVQPNTIEAHVKNLRKKLESVMNKRVIHTVRGAGYRLVNADETILEP